MTKLHYEKSFTNFTFQNSLFSNFTFQNSIFQNHFLKFNFSKFTFWNSLFKIYIRYTYKKPLSVKLFKTNLIVNTKQIFFEFHLFIFYSNDLISVTSGQTDRLTYIQNVAPYRPIGREKKSWCKCQQSASDQLSKWERLNLCSNLCWLRNIFFF